MKKGMRVIVIFLVLMAGFCIAAGGSGSLAAGASGGLLVYLPREAMVAGELINLGLIGVVRGEDALVAKASGVGLGRFSLAGQQIVIDRSTILSRLASSGIKGSQISLSGAETVTVKREEQTISADRFVETARLYLQSQLSGVSISSIEPVGRPAGWVLSGDDRAVKLAAKISKSSSSKLPNRIWVGVMEDGAEIGGREIVFKVKFKQQRVVALADIAEGAMIGSDNVRIETIEADRPLAKDWSVPYGMVARRRINKDSVITETMVRAVAPPILIERGQMVVIKIERPGMMISALGEAMGDGKVGDYIKIKRGFERDSPLIVGRVKPDGTVEPVY